MSLTGHRRTGVFGRFVQIRFECQIQENDRKLVEDFLSCLKGKKKSKEIENFLLEDAKLSDIFSHFNHFCCEVQKKLQFLKWPLEAGSKSESISIHPHVKMAEINMFTAWFWSVKLISLFMTIVEGVNYFKTQNLNDFKA